MKPCKDDDVIRRETTFVYDGDSYKFYLDDCTKEFGYLLTKFHIVADIEKAKKFIGIKEFFNGLLRDINIPVKCYIVGVNRRNMQLDKFEISIVGEEVH